MLDPSVTGGLGLHVRVLFPLIPQTCDIERMKQGGDHW